jgi:hypothetical protein
MRSISGLSFGRLSLLPTITLQGNASHSKDGDPTLSTFRTDQASILGQINAPIYDGGTGASQTRQAKETGRTKPTGARSGSQSGTHRCYRRVGFQ